MIQAAPGRPFRRAQVFAILVTVAAPAIAYGILKDTGTTLVAGTDPAPPLNALMRVAQAAPRSAPPNTRTLLPGLLRSAPLAFEPFFIAAALAPEDARQSRTALLEEARRRKFRDLATRSALMIRYAEMGNAQQMLGELSFIYQSNEDVRAGIVPELIKLMSKADGRAALAQALVGDPSWRRDFFAAANQAPAIKPDEVLDLLRRLRSGQASSSVELQASSLLLRSLIFAGRVEEARKQWLTTQPSSVRGLIYNQSFQPKLTDPLFGWKLGSGAQGSGEITAQGLNAHYYGGTEAILAEQIIALPPGRYRFSFDGFAQGEGGKSQLAWVIVCRADNRQLMNLNVAFAGQSQGRQGDAFSIPAGCSGQNLRLVGQPGDAQSDAALQARSVSIEPA